MIEKPVATINIIPASLVSELSKENVQLRETGITSNSSETDKEEKSISQAQIEMMFENVEYNKALYDVNLKYSLHHKSGRVVIAVFERSSGKLIREIPREELLELAEKMEEITGKIFDKMI